MHNCCVRRIHGLAVTSLLAGLLGLVLVVLVLPASAVPVPASYLILCGTREPGSPARYGPGSARFITRSTVTARHAGTAMRGAPQRRLCSIATEIA